MYLEFTPYTLIMGSVASKNHFQEVSDRLLTEDCPAEPDNEFWTGFWGSVEQATAVQIYESLSPTTGTKQWRVCN